MANDPNRDLLPVREDGCRTGKGFGDKFDHQILGKLSRCELEDRFLRLLDEQTHIKKLANNQEEKIKRLGTKLLRLVNEKKHGKKFSDQTKETEELNLRIIELEHENYTLKDKNTVLKQQLSSHSRHYSSHRSPVRSNHTSPLMTMRHCAPPAQSDFRSAFEATNKNEADEQLQEAEAHIRELNEEIKTLHSKIDFLQQNLEKNNLDNRKIKVSENIELIRLQRSLRQQAIQIASLQEQVKNSEKTQQILKDDLIKAHKENDEALHMIAEKQNEILSLCGKLEESNLNRMEEDELKERINDLVKERDYLKERSENLMNTIGAKAEESEKISELQKLLAEEKAKKEKLEEALELLKNNLKESTTAIVETSHSEKVKTVYRGQQTTPEKKASNHLFNRKGPRSSIKYPISLPFAHSEMMNFCCNTYEESESSRSQDSSVVRDFETDSEISETNYGQITIKRSHREYRGGKCVVEKMKLELELQYLREMLRSQTLRCEAQQAEICRLMYELKLNEEKCSDTLQRLDCHLRIFEGLERRTQLNEFDSKSQEPVGSNVQEKPLKVESVKVNQEPVKVSREPVNVEQDDSRRRASPVSIRKILPSRDVSKATLESDDSAMNRMRQNSSDMYPSKLVQPDTFPQQVIEEEEEEEVRRPRENRKRFVEQVFLDSSDEETRTLLNQPFLQNLEKEEIRSDRKYNSSKIIKAPSKRRDTSLTALPKIISESSLPSKPYEKEFKKELTRGGEGHRPDERVTITINWFRIKTDSSFWLKNQVEMLFIDFSFLDVNGAETETPQSIPKPESPDHKCEFNFTQSVTVSGNRLKRFQNLLKNLESQLIVFKLVSDSEKFDGINDECEDLGVAVITTKEFFDFCNKGSFTLQVKSVENNKDVIGTLSVNVQATPRLFNMT